jgi:uncharacterized protein (DUF58 family)
MAEPTQGPADPTRVHFPPGFVRRLEQLVAREHALREREEGAGRGRRAGAGEEFVGHRPYGPGEELRHLDWNLLARLDRPFVRVHRREAGERWAILLDTSASMGLGRPGKLQLAAEVATGLAFVGLRGGATTRVWVARNGGVATFGLRRRSDLARWLAFLESLRAEGAAGPSAILGDARLAGAARVFVVGDLLDLRPTDVLGLARAGRDLDVVQILAPHELAPDATPGAAQGDVTWLDPETGERLEVALEPGVRLRYERALESRLEAWSATCARHRVVHGTWSSATPFEDVVQRALSR